MKNNSIADFLKPTLITGQQYDTKVTVEIDHSDTDIDELFDAFQTICVGLGYHESTIKQWVLDRADEYTVDDVLAKPNLHEDGWDDDMEERYWKEQVPEPFATESELSNDGGFDGKPHFEWGNEPEDDDELDFPEPNEALKRAAKQYKKKVKKS